MKKITQAGFSLVELMVVVAIIGILATIAIPKVTKFIAKARQAEAQVNLSSLYTFDKNFNVEFTGYTNDFTAMGYAPEGKLRYNVGFGGAPVGPTNYTTLKGTAYSGKTDSLSVCPSNAGTGQGVACVTLKGSDNNDPPAIAGSSIASPFSTFIAIAIANLVQGGAGADQWSIDDTKNLRNLNDGTQ